MFQRLREIANTLEMPVVRRTEDGALLFVINDDCERVFVYQLDLGSGKLEEPQPRISNTPVCSFPVQRIEDSEQTRLDRMDVMPEQKDGTID